MHENPELRLSFLAVEIKFVSFNLDKVKRLTGELTSSQEGTGEIQKSAHPLEPVIHLVGDRKTKHHAIG